MKKIIILFITLFTLTGCSNYIELENLGVASSILIDYKDEYKITVEIYDDKKTETYKGTGKTVTDALEDALLSTEKTLNYTHLNAVLITEDVNVEDIIYYFLRNPNVNNNFYFVITEETDVYDKDENIGKTISNILSRDNTYDFFTLVHNYLKDGKDIALPVYDKGSINEVALFDNEKLVEKINYYEAGMWRILYSKDGAYIYTKCDDDFFELQIEKVKTNFSISNNIKIDVTAEASIAEMTCDFDTLKIEDITEMERLANKKLKKDIENFIETLKENKTDVLGINSMITNKYHKLDKKFDEYDYEIKTSIHIYKKGLLLK